MPDAPQNIEKWPHRISPDASSVRVTGENSADDTDGKVQPSHLATNVGGWIYSHKTVTTDNPIGYTTYQYLRSAAASVPYGLSMAGTWLGFEKLHGLGAGMAGVDKARIASGEALVSDAAKGFKGKFGYRMSQFTAHPQTRTAAMIGTSFSLYRGTSKIAKWVNEYLFDEDDSKQETIAKVQELPSAVWGKIAEVAPAEFNSTPVSAIVLGFMVLSFKAPKALGEATAANIAMKGQGAAKRFDHFWKEVVRNPETKFVEQAAINTMGYSLFFELGDRRFKDKQVSRGKWAGGAHSIGSGSRSNPSLISDDMDENERIKVTETNSRANDTLSLLTAEPSAIRFALRRVLPTSIGIAAYTAFKFRGMPLVFGQKFTEGLKSIKDIPKAGFEEGAATSLFFIVPFVTDKYAPRFDSFVNGLEDLVSGKKTPEAPKEPEFDLDHIKKHHVELHQQLDAKEKEMQGASLSR